MISTLVKKPITILRAVFSEPPSGRASALPHNPDCPRSRDDQWMKSPETEVSSFYDSSIARTGAKSWFCVPEYWCQGRAEPAHPDLGLGIAPSLSFSSTTIYQTWYKKRSSSPIVFVVCSFCVFLFFVFFSVCWLF